MRSRHSWSGSLLPSSSGLLGCMRLSLTLTLIINRGSKLEKRPPPLLLTYSSKSSTFCAANQRTGSPLPRSPTILAEAKTLKPSLKYANIWPQILTGVYKNQADDQYLNQITKQ